MKEKSDNISLIKTSRWRKFNEDAVIAFILFQMPVSDDGQQIDYIQPNFCA